MIDIRFQCDCGVIFTNLEHGIDRTMLNALKHSIRENHVLRIHGLINPKEHLVGKKAVLGS